MSRGVVGSSGDVVDWGELVERALAGDRAAYARLTRLVTGYLARWRAYDFRADWDDMVQEVLVSTVEAHREGRFDTPAAFQAYVRQAARFKFIDRIRSQQRKGREAELDDGDAAESSAAWPPAASVETRAVELRASVIEAVEKLEDRERRAVIEVHVRGRTYDEAAEATGIPLGTLKRALRTGLARLREVLEEDHRAR